MMEAVVSLRIADLMKLPIDGAQDGWVMECKNTLYSEHETPKPSH